MTQVVNELEIFVEFLSAEGLSSATIDSYRSDLVILNAFLRERYNHGLRDANEDELKQYTGYLSDHKYEARSVARIIASIKRFYQFLYDDGITDGNVAHKLISPKVRKTLPSYLTVEEVEKLIKFCRKSSEIEDIRLYVIVVMLYSLGLRVSELVNIRLRDVLSALRNRVSGLCIRGKGNKERIVPMDGAVLIPSIESYLAIRRNFIVSKSDDSVWFFPGKKFDQHITRQRIGQLLHDLAVKANVAPDRIHPHVFRHSFATHMLNNGADLSMIQKILGHSDINSTQIYMAVANDRLLEVVDMCHPMSLMKQRD